jgi:hypothetical protein
VLAETKSGLPVEFQIQNQMRMDAGITPGAVVKLDIPGVTTRGAVRIVNVYEDGLKETGRMTWGSIRTKAKMPAPVTQI